VTGVNIGDAIAAAAREGVILSGGGHAMAGGLSLEPDQVAAFDAWMVAHMAQFTAERAAALELPIDAVLAPGAASPALVDQVAAIGPFGAGSPEPVFALQSVHVTGTRQVGANHLKFTAEDSTGRLDCIAWRAIGAPLGDALTHGKRVHLAGRLKADEWNGRRRVQLDVLDAADA
jgi:single-stranded-DNA-specific exonuclease